MDTCVSPVRAARIAAVTGKSHEQSPRSHIRAQNGRSKLNDPPDGVRHGQVLDGAILLAVYSLGLGVPFLLSGLLFTRGLSSLAPLRKRTPLLVRGSGVVLMALGALLAFGQLTAITSDLSSAFPALV